MESLELWYVFYCLDLIKMSLTEIDKVSENGPVFLVYQCHSTLKCFINYYSANITSAYNVAYANKFDCLQSHHVNNNNRAIENVIIKRTVINKFTVHNRAAIMII